MTYTFVIHAGVEILETRSFFLTSTVEPLNIKGPLVMGVDPSKRGFALTIGRPYPHPIISVEFDGTGVETTKFCWEFTRFLDQWLVNADILFIETEDTLNMDDSAFERYNRGRGKVSDDALLEVKYQFKNWVAKRFGIDKYPQKSLWVNNGTWKHEVIPAAYNKKGIKGSLNYLIQRVSPAYSKVSDNISDSYCIYVHATQLMANTLEYYPDGEETIPEDRYYIIVNPEHPLEDLGDCCRFNYTPDISLENNIGFMMNRASDKNWRTTVPIDYLTLKDIYNALQVDVGTERLEYVDVVF